MRKGTLMLSLLIPAAFVVACQGGSGGLGVDEPAVTNDVILKIPTGAGSMGTKAFGDNPLIVQPGTRVTWDNQDSVTHRLKSSSGDWDSGTLNAGEGVYSQVFTTPGAYTYTAENGMTGTIVVK